MKIRLNNIKNEFDRQYSLTKFAYLPVICKGDSGAKYIVWFSDYKEFYDLKTNKLVTKYIKEN